MTHFENKPEIFKYFKITRLNLGNNNIGIMFVNYPSGRIFNQIFMGIIKELLKKISENYYTSAPESQIKKLENYMKFYIFIKNIFNDLIKFAKNFERQNDFPGNLGPSFRRFFHDFDMKDVKELNEISKKYRDQIIDMARFINSSSISNDQKTALGPIIEKFNLLGSGLEQDKLKFRNS